MFLHNMYIFFYSSNEVFPYNMFVYIFDDDADFLYSKCDNLQLLIFIYQMYFVLYYCLYYDSKLVKKYIFLLFYI